MRKQGALPTLRREEFMKVPYLVKVRYLDYQFVGNREDICENEDHACYGYIPRVGWHRFVIHFYFSATDPTTPLNTLLNSPTPVDVVPEGAIKLHLGLKNDVRSTFLVYETEATNSNASAFHLEQMQLLTEIKSQNYAHFVYLLGGMFGSVIALYFVFAHLINP